MSDNLPIVASRVEVATVDEFAENAAGLWKQKWGKLEDMELPQLAKAAAIIKAAHPWFTEIDVMKYFDFIGGSLRENAEYWMDMASRHPNFNSIHQEPIEPGTEEWQKWLGNTDPKAIAAAEITWVFRTDRTNPQAEVNYVKMDDPILFDYNVEFLRGASSEVNATKAAQEYVTDTRLFFKVFQPKGKTYWMGKYKELASDWPALAKKKARTTSVRRALLRSFSLQESRLAAIYGRIDDATAGRTVDMAGIQPIMNPPDTVRRPSISGPPAKRLVDGETRTEHDDEEKASPFTDRPILEKDRRKMHIWLNDRVIESGRSVHDELKTIVAEVQGVDFADASSKNVTYGQYERIRELCERYSLKDSGAPVQRPIVNPPRANSMAGHGKGDDKAGPASPASDPSLPSLADAEKTVRRLKSESAGRKPCIHNDDPDECSKCAEVEDRRFKEQEDNDTEQTSIPLGDPPPEGR